MKIKTLKLMSCITPVVVGLLAQSSFANTITGSVDFGGSATVNNNILGSATTITSISAIVTATLGSFSPALNGLTLTSSGAAGNNGSALTPGLMSTYQFTGTGAATGVTPLWAVTVGGVLYKFDATSLTAVFDSTLNQWDLGGNGTITIGTSTIAGTWGENLDGANNGSATFSFDANTQANVPDGGTTAMLLGGALMGLGLLKRKLMA